MERSNSSKEPAPSREASDLPERCGWPVAVERLGRSSAGAHLGGRRQAQAENGGERSGSCSRPLAGSGQRAPSRGRAIARYNDQPNGNPAHDARRWPRINDRRLTRCSQQQHGETLLAATVAH